MSRIAISLLVFLLAAIISNHLTLSCTTSDTSCSFYKCLEAKHRCNNGGYALGYGNKYCEKFKSNHYKTTAAVNWTKSVRKCLQSQLVKFTQKSSTSCLNIMNSAFDSHPHCYTSAGLCFITRKCFDPFNWQGYCHDLSSIVRTVDVSDLMTRRSAKQMKDTLVECVKRGASFTASVAKRYAQWIGSHFDDDDDDLAASLERMPDARGMKKLADALEQLEDNKEWIFELEGEQLA
eukprot:CAMPEP_0117443460 /NCGR_PEP_ID=MMETSP0759-20121206/4705_1 /TAXON_ID=63605 /ORGANISM="Percolomonas cosmopolitus, Strain WS" /LENGTH=234 /DNA_ID=CAMNT_0005235433 /DNA_START=1345 /DNA_END=2049 /DNA_ORIENTATION=-